MKVKVHWAQRIRLKGAGVRLGGNEQVAGNKGWWVCWKEDEVLCVCNLNSNSKTLFYKDCRERECVCVGGGGGGERKRECVCV